MTLNDFFYLILILSALSFCVFVFVYLKRISEQISAVSKDFHRLVENTIPVLNDLDEVIQHIRKIVTGVEGYWVEIDYSIKMLRNKISNFGPWKKFCESQELTTELIKSIKSISKGISVFWREYKRG